MSGRATNLRTLLFQRTGKVLIAHSWKHLLEDTVDGLEVFASEERLTQPNIRGEKARTKSVWSAAFCEALRGCACAPWVEHFFIGSI